MCGIAGYGYSDPRRAPDVGVLRAMTDTLVHRGPDDDGFWISGSVGLGFRRLSIIDLAGGHQPLFDETGEIGLIFNGEVYNFRELRAGLVDQGHRFRTGSDAEVLVHLYEERGPALLERLVGMFAFALLDRRGGATRLLLARDRLGIKPLYYAVDEAGLAFASEPKALLAGAERSAPGPRSRRLRAPALLDYLVQGYVGGELAAWEGLRRLPPGSTLTWEPGRAPVIARYWDLPLELREAPPEELLSAEIREWVDRAVRDRLVADVPLGAFLSGGIDSTAVVTSMASAGERAVVACSVGFAERSHDELARARATAQRLGAVHHTRVLAPDPALALEKLPWFFDEPHADPSNVPTYLVSAVAREHVTVALSGDGGDETFAGYRRYLHDVAENRVRQHVGAGGRALARGLGRVYPRMQWAPRFLRGRTFLANVGDDPARAYFRSVTLQERAEALALLAPELASSLAEHDPFREFERHYRRPTANDALYRAQYADFHTYLPDQILAKVDRASMAVALEVRVPLLDHRVVGRFANLPAASKVRGGRGKHALRAALRGRVPDDVLDGEKRGFDTPLRAWIRGPLAAAVDDALAALPGDWFDRSALLELRDQHRSGVRDHGRVLWSLLVLEHWRRRHDVRGLAG